MSEFQPGDIVEIKTPSGLAYVQVTHRHPAYPEVVRGLPGKYDTRPENPAGLAERGGTFTAMMPLGGAIAMGTLMGEKVGSAAIPENEHAFPTFRMAIRDKHGAIAYWWFWDGDSLHYDAHPAPETESYPLREVLTAAGLLKRITAADKA